jgi:tetratricopeptide (TPR) repeat protein
VYRVDAATADRIRANGDALSIWAVDGGAANSREGFFQALATALKFPAYFGHNWDAAYDCLTDLASADAKPAVLFITHGAEFLAGMEADWATGERVFTDAAAFWQRGGRLLLVLLVSDTPLPGTPTLPPDCLEQVAPPADAEHEITVADERIRLLNRSGKFEDALQAACELVGRFPDNPHAHFVLAGTLDFQDREADAVPPYQRAWELGLAGDDVPRFYVQYGSTLRNVGQFGEAVRGLQEGRARFPENAAIQAFLALALFSAGRAAEALATALSIVTSPATSPSLRGYERALREYVAALLPSDEAR